MVNQKGQSPLISGILYTLISIVIVSIVMQVGLPYIDRLQDFGELENIESMMKEMDKSISIIASEGTDSQRTISLELSEDSLDVNGDAETIIVEKTTKAKIMNPRSRKTQGNFFKGVNVEADAYTGTLNGDAVYIMENEYIYFAIRKLDSDTPMKAYDLVKKVTLKTTNEDLNALVDFYMDSYAGGDVNISTEFVSSGYNQGRVEVKANLTASDHNYAVHFRLESGSDFIRIWASDAQWS